MNKNTSKTFGGIEDYEKDCYLFSPSVSKRKTVCGKAYFIRRYFRGGKDFEKTMETLAVRHTTQKVR